MRNYKLKLEKYGISKAAYEELRGFCLQYEEKKQKIKMGCGELEEKYLKDIETIEEAAKETDDFLAPFIIKSVTSEHLPAWALISRYNMPENEKAFNLKRRKFYYLLAIKKQIIEE
jgi:hypothetical protein